MPIVAQPMDPSGGQGVFNSLPYPPYLGVFLFANLPTQMPASLGGGPIPPGAMATCTNCTSVVRGAATTGAGAVILQIFWDGGTWRN
jgi:hypothetical protein